MENWSFEEQEAASVVANLSGKHDRVDSPDAAGGSSAKKIRAEHPDPAPIAVAESEEDVRGELKPYPYFFYKDFSTQEDPDSLTPLTPPGRVPNFPAKMHAILSRTDLADIVCWMPHGRSWKVLKPREFEIRVIPTYFEHAKFSSFIRQANGWGFRRITTGRGRNSYYHPLFLRGLPYLCKEMKRPGVAKKLAADPEHEPDLYKISELHPVPEKPVDESILLQCTLQGGPKARMPIYSGMLNFWTDTKLPPAESKMAAAASVTAPLVPLMTPHDKESLLTFQGALGMLDEKPAAVASAPMMFQPIVTMPPALPQMFGGSNKVSALAAANQLAFSNPMAAAFQASAATQFAAGFAAAAAMSQQQLQEMMNSLQGFPSNNNNN